MKRAKTQGRLMLFVIFFIGPLLIADAPASAPVERELPLKQETSLFEVSPWIKKIEMIKTSGLLRVVVKASAQTSCYKQREIERIFEKNTLKIVLRLKKPQELEECPQHFLDYEEKIYESAIDLAPANIWVLGYEGWHKLKVHP